MHGLPRERDQGEPSEQEKSLKTRGVSCRSSGERKYFDRQDEGRSRWLKSNFKPVTLRAYSLQTCCSVVIYQHHPVHFCFTTCSNDFTYSGKLALAQKQLRHFFAGCHPCSVHLVGTFPGSVRLWSLWAGSLFGLGVGMLRR